MTLRACIWAAVSTAEQARKGEKFSLEIQQERCRALIAEKGWKESGCFIASGYSRTKYLYLPDAERAIPQLHDLMDAVRNRRMDVICMTEADRLRGLIDQVRETSARYGVQLYSIAQPVEILPPSQFDQYASDAASIVLGMSSIISRADIGRGRRKYRESMPKRISEKGLPQIIPWGYRRPKGREDSRSAVPEPDPVLARHLRKMRDLLLAGRSIRQIVEYLETHGVPAPRGGERWHPDSVRRILRNPFYAGWVEWGRSHVYLNPEGRRVRNMHMPDSDVARARGKHEPLWDDDTRRAIVAELHRRAKSYSGKRTTQFTGLIYCACGAPMWRRTNGPTREKYIWRCSSDLSHPSILHSRLLELVAGALTAPAHARAPKRRSSMPQDRRADLADARTELDGQLERLETAYLSGKFTLERYGHHKERLERQLGDIDDELANIARADAARRAFEHRRKALAALPDVATWLRKDDVYLVNRDLSLLVEQIVIFSPDHIRLKFR